MKARYVNPRFIFRYYHRSRTRLSLAEDSPEPRPIQPPENGGSGGGVLGSGDYTTGMNDGRPETARIYRCDGALPLLAL
jgi:hypothetical protein